METIVLKTSKEYSNIAAMEPWLKEIEERSNGRVKFTYYGDEFIKKGTDQLAVVLNGTNDVRDFYPTHQTDDFPLSDIVSMPFFYPSGEVAAAVGWELIEKYMLDTEYKEVKPLWIFVPGIFDFHFSSRPVYKLEDLKHMKFPVHGSVMCGALRALGAEPVEAERDELLSLVERGILDGTTIPWGFPGGIGDIYKYSTANLRIWTVLKPFIMNLKTWNRLPPDIQKIFEDCSGLKKSQEVGAAFDKSDREGLEKAKRSGKPELIYLSEDEKARWVEAVQPWIAEWINTMEDRGLPGKAIVEDARKLVKQYSK